ncbi:type 4a pilus biogenesis protein PilO [Reinekea sp.]|uniref:type 4a pilus biogenesis protein PilO n=1 Tax=Reinekea sp. TaxID=1970455 RepID=UPI00398A46FD
MSAKGFFEGFKEFDYENPDFNNIGSWPLVVRITALLLVAALIVFGFYWFTVKASQERFVREQGKEQGLKEQYRTKSFRVANLDAFKEQLAEMEETFGALLSQLPDETEMPGLLDDISTTGTQSGLEIDKITPQGEQTKEFYIETPINITVRGSYHEMGNFVSAMAAIPRIVTLHDFDISTQSRSSSSGDEAEAPLSMRISAKTYRYKAEE